MLYVAAGEKNARCARIPEQPEANKHAPDDQKAANTLEPVPQQVARLEPDLKWVVRLEPYLQWVVRLEPYL